MLPPSFAILLHSIAISLVIITTAVAQTFTVPLNSKDGRGICSPNNVTSFSYSVTASSPGLQAVLACNLEAYNALMYANLSSPDAANLPAPLLEMSCTEGRITSCTKTFPTDRRLRSQVMCILLKATEAGGGGGNGIQATIQAVWENGAPSPSTVEIPSTNGTGLNADGTSTSLSRGAIAGIAIAGFAVVSILVAAAVMYRRKRRSSPSQPTALATPPLKTNAKQANTTLPNMKMATGSPSPAEYPMHTNPVYANPMMVQGGGAMPSPPGYYYPPQGYPMQVNGEMGIFVPMAHQPTPMSSADGVASMSSAMMSPPQL